jgi:hypothetical protein
VAFNLRELASGTLRDQLAARVGSLEEARRTAAGLTDRLTGMFE